VTNFRFVTSCALLIFGLVASVGCDDDETDTSPGAGSGGSAAGRSGSGGRGGAGGSTPAPIRIACGTTTCMLPPTANPLEGYVLQQPCCADEAKSICGWTPPGGGGTCTAPPPVDEDCPLSGIGQLGCCLTEIDRCGIDGSMYGVGCYNLVESRFAEGNPNIVARTCDGAVVGDDTDGGVDSDAGLESDAGQL
jgi:hypothetical protein